MSQPAPHDPFDLSDAVKAVRARLGESQQQFALRLNTAVQTVSRYERGAKPSGKVLAQLERIAVSIDAPEATAFRDALHEDLGITYFGRSQHLARAVFTSGDEALYAAALLLVMRSGAPSAAEGGALKYEATWKNIQKALKLPLEDLQRSYSLVDRYMKAMRQLVEGNSFDQVSERSQIGVSTLRKVYGIFQQAWPDVPGDSEDARYGLCHQALLQLAQRMWKLDLTQIVLKGNDALAERLISLANAIGITQ